MFEAHMVKLRKRKICNSQLIRGMYFDSKAGKVSPFFSIIYLTLLNLQPLNIFRNIAKATSYYNEVIQLLLGSFTLLFQLYWHQPQNWTFVTESTAINGEKWFIEITLKIISKILKKWNWIFHWHLCATCLSQIFATKVFRWDESNR